MNKVILVIIDGLRCDVAFKEMRYMVRLTREGLAARFTLKAEMPSLSKPLYETLLTGIPPYISGVTSNEFKGRSTQKSIFHLTKEKGLINAAAAYYWISELYNCYPFDPPLHREQEKEDMPIQFGRFYFEDDYPDSHLFVDGEILRRKYKPDFLLIHPMGVDYFGHLYGGSSREYAKKTSETDGLLSKYIPLWLDDGYQVIVTADHGMDDFGNHGGESSEERDVPLFLVGDRFTSVCYEPPSQLGIAPLICRLLEINPSKAMDSITSPATMGGLS